MCRDFRPKGAGCVPDLWGLKSLKCRTKFLDNISVRYMILIFVKNKNIIHWEKRCGVFRRIIFGMIDVEANRTVE